MCSQFFDVKRKDFWEMFIHHNTTILLIALSWTAHFTRVTNRKSWQITTQITTTPQITNHDKSPQHHNTPQWPLPLHQGNKPQITIQTTTQNTTTSLHLQLPQLFWKAISTTLSIHPKQCFTATFSSSQVLTRLCCNRLAPLWSWCTTAPTTCWSLPNCWSTPDSKTPATSFLDSSHSLGLSQGGDGYH